MDKIKKLSDAIELGSIGKKQGRGGNSIMSDTAPCVLGMVRIACGIENCNIVNVYDILENRFPILKKHVNNPAYDAYGSPRGTKRTLMDVCWSTNDAGWSVKEIIEVVKKHEDTETREA